jgi:hypothetical protein
MSTGLKTRSGKKKVENSNKLTFRESQRRAALNPFHIMLNALTIDVEDYFQVHAFSNVIRFEDWGHYECRVEKNTDRLLEILNSAQRFPLLQQEENKVLSSPKESTPPRKGVKATFFILGWIAERYPDLIRRIQREGHEIACHGCSHQIIYAQTKEQFRKKQE